MPRQHDYTMRQSALGKLVASLYGRSRLFTRLLGRAVATEGGQMYSLTLRQVMADHHDVHIGPYSYGSLCEPGSADRGTTIGPYVSIGPNVRRFGAAHPLDRESLHPLFYNPALGLVGPSADVERSTCVVEAEAWIGANSVILPGCRRIGVGAVVGAASVVTRDVPDFAIVVGSPARQIGTRLDPDERNRLLRRRPWELEPTQRHALI